MTQDVLDAMYSEANQWIQDVQNDLKDIFPTETESAAFLRVISSPLGRSGWNIKHNALLNKVEAHVEKLLQYQKIVNSYVKKPLESPVVVTAISIISAIIGSVIGGWIIFYLTRQ